MSETPNGLCDSCEQQRIVRNTRGSSFSLCERSRTDAAFPRYPPVPVLRCTGYVRRAEGPGEGFPGPSSGRR